MKTEFGTPLSRLLRGGVVLIGVEAWALPTLVTSLPAELRQIVEAQFQRYVLVQREADGRALNFYPRRREISKLSAPLLKMSADDAPLLRLKISIANPPRTIHAVLRAVVGRVFCVSFSEDMRPLANASGFEAVEVEHSWRSNFRLADHAHD